MKWIQATLTFHPSQVNLARAGRFGSWRIHHCAEVGNPLKTRVDHEFKQYGSMKAAFKVMRIMVARPYTRGAIVNPVKLALAFNDAARENSERIAAIMHNKDVIQFGSNA